MTLQARNKHAGTAALALAFAALLCAPSFASSPANDIADGKPWSAKASNGRTMQMTLNPDGTGRMKMGIMSMSVKWQATDDGMCLSGMPGSPRCITLTKVPGGYVGSEEGVESMSLTRN